MTNNDMMGNWMAAMGMMGTMMAQFQQQAHGLTFDRKPSFLTFNWDIFVANVTLSLKL